MTRGLLLFAHGARDPRWALPFEDVAQRIRAADGSVPVALSYLEFMSPGLVEAGESLVAQGCTRVEVVPLFLGAGGHVRKDLPAAARLAARGPPAGAVAAAARRRRGRQRRRGHGRGPRCDRDTAV